MPVSNAYLLEKFRVDTAENNPCKVSRGAHRGRATGSTRRPAAARGVLGAPVRNEEPRAMDEEGIVRKRDFITRCIWHSS